MKKYAHQILSVTRFGLALLCNVFMLHTAFSDVDDTMVVNGNNISNKSYDNCDKIARVGSMSKLILSGDNAIASTVKSELVLDELRLSAFKEPVDIVTSELVTNNSNDEMHTEIFGLVLGNNVEVGVMKSGLVLNDGKNKNNSVVIQSGAEVTAQAASIKPDTKLVQSGKSQDEVYFSIYPNGSHCKCEGYADLVEVLAPAVVSLSVTSIKEIPVPSIGKFFEFFFPFDQVEGDKPNTIKRKTGILDSGFFITQDGIIATNYHVIEDAENILVTTKDNREFKATLVGFDKKTDIAVLKIKSTEKFPYLQFGNSSDARIGSRVIAIGNPSGLGGTVTSGIISGKSRHISQAHYEDFIQTDASVNRGSSGGPLITLDGKVVGIVTALISSNERGGSIGLNFAIPSDLAKSVTKRLINKEKIVRGWIGIQYLPVDEKIADAVGLSSVQGIFVNDVVSGSPAAKAGLKKGDVMLTFNGVKIDKGVYLPTLLFDVKIGSPVDVEIWRDNKKGKYTIIVEEQKDLEDSAKEKKSTSNNGLVGVSEITPEITNKFNLPADLKGVLITDIQSDLLKQNMELKRGDVITKFNGVQITNIKSFEDAVASAKRIKKRHVIVEVFRKGKYELEAVQILE